MAAKKVVHAAEVSEGLEGLRRYVKIGLGALKVSDVSVAFKDAREMRFSLPDKFALGLEWRVVEGEGEWDWDARLKRHVCRPCFSIDRKERGRWHPVAHNYIGEAFAARALVGDMVRVMINAAMVEVRDNS